jgi:hypothetical protein
MGRDFAAVAGALVLLAQVAQGQIVSPPEHQQVARQLLRELVEINTTRDSGATRAAEALVQRLKAGGFATGDS